MGKSEIELMSVSSDAGEISPVFFRHSRVSLKLIEPDGSLTVIGDDGEVHACDILELRDSMNVELHPGDELLALVSSVTSGRGVVLGRISRYSAPLQRRNITIEATESLTLKCGEAQVDLRADGKVMVKGDDVLIRAKGTQRIRAGTVAIN